MITCTRRMLRLEAVKLRLLPQQIWISGLPKIVIEFYCKLTYMIKLV